MMGRLINLTGNRYGKLTVLKRHKENDKYNKPQWLCQCDCGKEIIVLGNNLRLGLSESCGCVRIEKNKRRTTHGFTKGGEIQRFYRIWANMIQRCTNPKVPSYVNYGERGITVCEQWSDFEKFKDDMYKSYLEHVDEFGEENTSINRIDNDKGYFLDNCEWETNSYQVINTRVRKDNESGHKGISQRKNGTWQAYITRNGIRKSRTFTEFEPALEWRKSKQNESITG